MVVSFGMEGTRHPGGVAAAPCWRRSVLAGQQQRGDAAVPFGDDPERQTWGDLVGREQAVSAGLQRSIVLPPAAVVEIPPVTAKVAAQVGKRIEQALLDYWTVIIESGVILRVGSKYFHFTDLGCSLYLRMKRMGFLFKSSTNYKTPPPNN